MQNGHANPDPQFQNIMMMDWIAREMKEIPELESEKLKDTNPILKVEFPEEGGILTYMGGYEHPYRGFPLGEFVGRVDMIKKLSRNLLSGFYHSIKDKNKFLLMFMLPTLLIARDGIYTGIYTFHRIIERFKLRFNRYSKAMRELYRVFNQPRNKEPLKILELRLMLRDLICMVLEFDNAYRFRFQDVVAELNKENLKSNPIKELNRLLDIISRREKQQEIKDTWRLFRMGVNYYLRFDRKFLKMMVDILSDLNLDEIKLGADDKLYCVKRYDYEFGFMENPDEEDKILMVKEVKLKEHAKKRDELDRKLALEVQEFANKQIAEQNEKINLSEETKKKINNEIQELQKKSNEEFNKIPIETPLKYLTQEQKNLVERQKKEKEALFTEHDRQRGELAASYGL